MPLTRPTAECPAGRPVSVGSLQRREGRGPHSRDRPLQPRRCCRPAEPPRRSGRKSAVAAGTIFAAAAALGPSVLHDAGIAARAGGSGHPAGIAGGAAAAALDDIGPGHQATRAPGTGTAVAVRQLATTVSAYDPAPSPVAGHAGPVPDPEVPAQALTVDLTPAGPALTLPLPTTRTGSVLMANAPIRSVAGAPSIGVSAAAAIGPLTPDLHAGKAEVVLPDVTLPAVVTT